MRCEIQTLSYFARKNFAEIVITVSIHITIIIIKKTKYVHCMFDRNRQSYSICTDSVQKRDFCDDQVQRSIFGMSDI